MANSNEYLGKRYGRLVVEKICGYKYGRHLIVSCVCDCGNKIETQIRFLRNGDTTSCGCYKRECDKDKVKNNKKMRENKGYYQQTAITSLTMKTPVDNTSGIKGVSWNKQHQKYEAYISLNKRRKHIGLFSDLEDAKKARQRAEEEIFDPVIEEYELTRKE